MISTADKLRPQLPPSERDFSIYRFVKIERHSTRLAAEQFRLSQTRVRQILSAMVEYLVESVPVDDEGRQIERLQVAEQLAREQLDFLYGEAIRQFRISAVGMHGLPAVPRASFLALAARITMCMARVPVHLPPRLRVDDGGGGLLSGEAEDGRAGETPTPRKAAAGEACAPRGGHPSVEDCSAPAVSSAACDAEGELSDAVTAGTDAAYRLRQRNQAAARSKLLRPAQAIAAEDSESLDRGDDLLPSTLPQATAEPAFQRPLNRKERRARQRQLQRALAKRKRRGKTLK